MFLLEKPILIYKKHFVLDWGYATSIEDPLPPPSCCSSALYLLADSALASGDMTARLAGVTVGDILVDFVSWASHDRGQGARRLGWRLNR